MRRRLLWILFVTWTLAAAPYAQNPQRPEAAPTGLLMGVVVDPIDNQPVPNAEVRLGGAPPGIANPIVLTDTDGRFVFMGLPKGSFTITATRAGYAEGAYGRLRPQGLSQLLTLADGERLGDLKIPIWKLAAVTGRVTDEAGQPVVAVFVRVLQRTVVAGKQKLTPGAMARTDDRGIYRIPSLTPGEYVVVVPSTQTTAPDSVVDLFQRMQFDPARGNSDFLRGLSFSGGNDVLYALQRQVNTRAGRQQFASIGTGTRAAVAPGPSANGRLYVYPTQYHPSGSTASAAQILTLRSGEERTAIDIPLNLTATSSVSGAVKGPDGAVTAVLTLVPDSDDLATDSGLETAMTISDQAGRFTFVGVPEGRYRLRALWAEVPVSGASRGAPPPPPRGEAAPATPPVPALGGFTLWATQTIAVGSSDINDLAINMRGGFRIGGRAEFVGARAQPTPDVLRRMTAAFDPADGRPFFSTIVGRGQFDEQGRLSSYQLPPSRYYVRINNVPPGWALKTAILNGRDVSNVPLSLDTDVTSLVVTFTDRAPSTLAGQVTAASGGADSLATVLVFPSDSGAWTDYGAFPRRLRAVRVDRNGQFQTDGLPPGDYFIIAIRDDAAANWQEPKVLQALSRLATAITLGDGESRSVPLKTSTVVVR